MLTSRGNHEKADTLRNTVWCASNVLVTAETLLVDSMRLFRLAHIIFIVSCFRSGYIFRSLGQSSGLITIITDPNYYSSSFWDLISYYNWYDLYYSYIKILQIQVYSLKNTSLLVEFVNIFMAKWVPLECGKGAEGEYVINSCTVSFPCLGRERALSMNQDLGRYCGPV
jgi:hypothetical protein